MHEEKKKFIEGLIFPGIFLLILWGIRLTEEICKLSFVEYGILPRTISGLKGIFFSPLIHGDTSHLLSNSLPLLILGIIVFYFYRSIAFDIFFWIYILTNLWVWISGSQKGYHVGASGIIYGFVSFLFFSGVFRKDRKSLALALLVAFVYGGLVWGVFPVFPGVSWESHFFGALTGAIAAYVYRHVDKEPEDLQEEEDESFNPENLPDNNQL